MTYCYSKPHLVRRRLSTSQIHAMFHWKPIICSSRWYSALLRTQFKCLENVRSGWVIPRICLWLGPHMYLDWEERSCILLVSIYLCCVSAPSPFGILWMNQTKDSKHLKSVYSSIVTIAHRVPPPPFQDAYAHASLPFHSLHSAAGSMAASF